MLIESDDCHHKLSNNTKILHNDELDPINEVDLWLRSTREIFVPLAPRIWWTLGLFYGAGQLALIPNRNVKY